MDGYPARPKPNTRVTSRQLASNALSVHSSRFLPWGQIAVDGARTDLQGLLNLRHGKATLMQYAGACGLGFCRPLGTAVIPAFPLGHGNPGRLPFPAILVLNLR